MQVTLRWAGATDSDSDTDYKIYTDVTTPATFVLLTTRDSTSPYVPVDEALTSNITNSATSIQFDSAAFSNGDYVCIGKEVIQLGAPTGATYANCSRGVGGTIATAHTAGDIGYKVHESYSYSLSFGSRHAIRHRVTRVQGSSESIAAESIAISPTSPPTSNLTTVYGVVNDMNGDPSSGLDVVVSMSDTDNYHGDTSELIYSINKSIETDDDGYFEIFLPRNVTLIGGATFTIKIGTGTSLVTWNIPAIPDVDSINFLEL